MPATYSLTLTDPQNALVQYLTQQWNLEKGTTFDAQTFILNQLASVLAPYAEAYKQTLLAAVQTNFASADPTTQAQVKSLLKLP